MSSNYLNANTYTNSFRFTEEVTQVNIGDYKGDCDYIFRIICTLLDPHILANNPILFALILLSSTVQLWKVREYFPERVSQREISMVLMNRAWSKITMCAGGDAFKITDHALLLKRAIVHNLRKGLIAYAEHRGDVEKYILEFVDLYALINFMKGSVVSTDIDFLTGILATAKDMGLFFKQGGVLEVAMSNYLGVLVDDSESDTFASLEDMRQENLLADPIFDSRPGNKFAPIRSDKIFPFCTSLEMGVLIDQHLLLRAHPGGCIITIRESGHAIRVRNRNIESKYSKIKLMEARVRVEEVVDGKETDRYFDLCLYLFDANKFLVVTEHTLSGKVFGLYSLYDEAHPQRRDDEGDPDSSFLFDTRFRFVLPP